LLCDAASVTRISEGSNTTPPQKVWGGLGCCPERYAQLGKGGWMRRPRGPAKWGEMWIVRNLGGIRWVMRRDPWRGVCPPVATPPCAYCGCADCLKAEVEIEAMKKPTARVVTADEARQRAETPKLLAKLPLTADLLLSPVWEDGDTKGDTALFVFASGPFVKLLVKVSNPPLKMMVQGRTWDEAWAALELLLKGDDVPWEQDGYVKPTRSKKKK